MIVSASKTYAMLGNAALWETAQTCCRALAERGVPHVVAGGVAVCLHGYRRNTIDLDLLVRKTDEPTIRQAMEATGLVWNAEAAEFRAPSGIVVQFLVAGERAGAGSSFSLPDPSEKKTRQEIEGLPTLALARLIECKIASGEGSLRRTHKDFADVIELVAANGLGQSYVRFLDRSVRKTYRELVRRANG